MEQVDSSSWLVEQETPVHQSTGISCRRTDTLVKMLIGAAVCAFLLKGYALNTFGMNNNNDLGVEKKWTQTHSLLCVW